MTTSIISPLQVYLARHCPANGASTARLRRCTQRRYIRYLISMKLYRSRQGIVVEDADRSYTVNASPGTIWWLAKICLIIWPGSLATRNRRMLRRKKCFRPSAARKSGRRELPTIAAATRAWRSRRAPAAAISTIAFIRRRGRSCSSKSTAHRVVGPQAKVAIRDDASWSVPEPELTLFVTPRGQDCRLHHWQRHEFARHRGRESAVSSAGESL